jgi:hypothetical protein
LAVMRSPSHRVDYQPHRVVQTVCNHYPLSAALQVPSQYS